MTAQVHPLTRVVDELLWSVRRAGFTVSTAQAIDAARAVSLVGFDDEHRLAAALAAVVVTDGRDVDRFTRSVGDFFRGGVGRDPWERLRAQGFTEGELDALRALLDAEASADTALLAALLFRGSELDARLLAGRAAAAARGLGSDAQLGFVTHKVLGELGVPRATARLAALRRALASALGERGEALGAALARELDGAAGHVRAHLEEVLAARLRTAPRASATSPLDRPLDALDAAATEEVRRAVRAFADRMRGGARVRLRHAQRGAIDPRRTLGQALRTFGVPVHIARKRRRPERPRVVLLCDVSDSVRASSRFMLELVHAMHDLFSGTRSFVFVSALAETTACFARSVAAAAALPAALSAVPLTENSNYGRALRAFEAREGRSLDRRTTLVVLGDGRSNFQDAGADVVGRLRSRVRALYWLCPEPRDRWTQSDSAMARYEPHCSRVLSVQTARDLEVAARTLVRGV